MKLEEAIRLIDNAALRQLNAHWTDLGCGDGLFTHALANVLGPGSRIEAVDKSPATMHPYPNPNNVAIVRHRLNFVTDKIPFRQLDGILMANSLHYVEQPLLLLRSLSDHLKPGGSLLIVEYEAHKANAWVPYPLSFMRLQTISASAGYPDTAKLREMPSVFNNGLIYAALIKK